jgi:hypothetical protein
MNAAVSGRNHRECFELGGEVAQEKAIFKEGKLDLRDAKAGTLLNGKQSSPKEEQSFSSWFCL